MLSARAAAGPSFGGGWFALGNLAVRAGDPEAARECYSRLVALHPGHARGHFALGNVHARCLRSIARNAYLRALELDPDLAGVWGNLGNIEKYFGRFPKRSTAIGARSTRDRSALQARRHSNLLLALHYDESLSHDALFAHIASGRIAMRGRLYPAPAGRTRGRRAPPAARLRFGELWRR